MRLFFSKINKKPFLIFILVVSLIFSSNSVFAQSISEEDGGVESIKTFYSTVEVNRDNSISVEEKIVYETGGIERHGIYRDINLLSSTKNRMSITDITVSDETGNAHVFELSKTGNYQRVKIGDPNKTFVGARVYIIKYIAKRAVGQFSDFDEIYWNATGNEWKIPIFDAKALVKLPDGTSVSKAACYLGPKGATEPCSNIYDRQNNVREFVAGKYLRPGDGLTVAIGFTKGVVTPYSSVDFVATVFDSLKAWIFSLMIPFLVTIFSYIYWFKKGRDPKGKRVIIPQYDVPDGLSPLEVVAIVSENVSSAHLSSEIVYLATHGYIKIRQIESKTLGIFSNTDYELTKVREPSEEMNDFDIKLMTSLFEGGRVSIKLSELKNKFYTKVEGILSLVRNGLVKKQYYHNLGRAKYSSSGIGVYIFFLIWAPFFFGGMIGGFIFDGNVFPPILSIFLALVVLLVFYYLSPSKTENGVRVKEYILGLKKYLEIAEKNRLEFHNAPEKKPEVFEKFLPYAMVLGVAKIWAKEFEGIYAEEPSWYSGSSGSTFSAIAFSNTLSNFGSSASSTLSSSPSSSGSGGGGSSGGGGGGGGGGGW